MTIGQLKTSSVLKECKAELARLDSRAWLTDGTNEQQAEKRKDSETIKLFLYRLG